jgi:hypothetical protein
MVSLRMIGLASAVYHGVKSMMLIRGVFNSTDGAVRIMYGVLPLHNITVTGLPLSFMVTGVSVVYCIVKVVLWVSLCRY